MQFTMNDLSDLTILLFLKDISKKALKEISDFQEVKLTEEELEASAIVLAMDSLGDFVSGKEELQKKSEEVFGKEYLKEICTFDLNLGESIDLTFLEEM